MFYGRPGSYQLRRPVDSLNNASWSMPIIENGLTRVLTAARHLEQIVRVKLFEDRAFELNELVWNHDRQESLVVGVNRNVDSDDLEENEAGMENWM